MKALVRRLASSTQTTFLAFGAAVAAAAVLGAVLFQQMSKAEAAEREIVEVSARAERIALTGVDLLQSVTEAETAQRGYLLTGQGFYLQPLQGLNARFDRDIKTLHAVARAEPVFADGVDRIERLAERRLALVDRTVRLFRAGRRAEALAVVETGEGQAVMAALRAETAALTARSTGVRRALEQRLRNADTAANRLEAGLILVVTVALGIAAGSVVLERSATRRAADALRQANQELLTARADAERANAAKSRFLAAASHDMRQPLHALSLYLAALDRRVDAPEARKVLENMDSAVRSMTRMFAALLDLARLEAGALKPEPVDFALGDLLRDVLDQLGDVKGAGEVDVRLAATALQVRSDPDLLEIVLRNLAVNAVKYAAGGRVLIGARRLGDTVRIEVHDSGPGIPVDRLHGLFAEFVRGDGPKSAEGIGLGLSIVDRFCRLLGHGLEVRSEVGRGSVFSVTVPRASSGTAPARTSEVATLPGVRVLVADDEALVLDAMRVALQDAGAAVSVARSGDEIRQAAAEPFDLYVFDLNLGSESGLELLDAMETKGRSLQALIVTGSTAADTLDALRRSGREWLTKPVSAVDLTRAAARLLGRTA